MDCRKGFGSSRLEQFSYTITQSSVIVNAQLNTLIQRGRASILATPQIATLNNHEASLLVGEIYPVITTGLPTVQNVAVGVKLRLTPTIGPNGAITAEI
jgi:type II secretory pathway component GspD/PulD (secretin)